MEYPTAEKVFTTYDPIARKLEEKNAQIAELSKLVSIAPNIEGYAASDYARLFEKNNTEGVKKYGVAWLEFNASIIQGLDFFNMDIDNEKVKAFGTTLALVILSARSIDIESWIE